MLSKYPAITAPTTYTELEGSPNISFDERGVTGVRTFKVHGQVLSQFMAGMSGSPYMEDAPEALPGFPTVLCVSAGAEPFKGSKGLSTAFSPDGFTPTNPAAMTSEWWRVTCRFEVPNGISYDFAGEGLGLPINNIGWFGDPTPISGMGLVTTIPCGELQMVRRNVPQLIPNRILSKVGTVNSAAFSPQQIDLNWRRRVGLGTTEIYPANHLRDSTIDPGCALFLGASSNPVVDALGFMSFNMTYKFSIRPDYAPWNKFFRVEKANGLSGPSGRWEYLFVKGPESQRALELYPPTSFDELFL